MTTEPPATPPTSPTPPTIPPLRRECEPPQPPVGPWMPLSLLGTATMLTVATAFGVMTRMPHDEPVTRVSEVTDDWRTVAPPPSQPNVPRATRVKEDPRAADVRKAVEERRPALEACMRQWAKRSSRSAAGVHVTFILKQSGAIEHFSTYGLADRAVPTCIAKTLRPMHLPSGGEDAFVLIGMRYLDGEYDFVASVTPESAFGPP